MAKQQTAKVLYIQTRYFIKRNGSVCCKVISGEKTYTTCLHANGRTSCTCEAASYGRFCKHVRLVIESEGARVAPVAVEVAPVEAVVEIDTTFFGEDGLDNRLASTWKTRNKRTKVEQAEYVKGFNEKLQASKDAQLQEAS